MQGQLLEAKQEPLTRKRCVELVIQEEIKMLGRVCTVKLHPVDSNALRIVLGLVPC